MSITLNIFWGLAGLILGFLLMLFSGLFFFAAAVILSEAKHVAPCLRYEDCMFTDTYNLHSMNEVDDENRCLRINSLVLNHWFSTMYVHFGSWNKAVFCLAALALFCKS